MQKQNHSESEALYLKQQADDAQAAMKATLNEMQDKLKDIVDLRVWTQRYPWISTAVAAGVGFAAGAVVTPRDRKDAKHKWEWIKSMFDSKLAQGQAEARGASRAARAGTRSFGAVALRRVLKVIRPVLASAVTAAMRGKHSGVPTNGHEYATHPI